MKKLFLTGGTSLLGKALIAETPPGWKIILTQHKHRNIFPKSKDVEPVILDVTDQTQISTLIARLKPQLVLHAAALSNVDFCQTHQKESWKVNVDGTTNIIKACEQNGILLVFISSNAVFDGKKEDYSEKDEPNPLNFYGRTKYEGEKIVKQAKIPWTIVRLITMYGWQPKGARQNPVAWALEKLANGEKLKIVDDVRLNPLYNHDAAQALWTIIEKGQPKNIYHVAGSEIINRYQWAVETAKIFGYDPSFVSPVPSSFFGERIAPRPSQTIYSIEKIKRELGIVPQGIKEGLEAMREERSHE